MNHKVQPLKCRDKWLHFDDPVIMGVINLTEDSFYSGSRIVETDAIITRMKEMEAAGAEVIDLGAMSSRPGAAISSPERELELLMPVLQDLPADLDVIVSIDTIHSKVARGCLDKGAHIINDITAGHFDEK
ncbi:MAG: dihydropteroate synthase, partial [Saprospiraceae bacterium]|nr:dihydropteroate synthase [Saprospiraceae bacterium]